jgi:long-chain acyl-CoA synthetase
MTTIMNRGIANAAQLILVPRFDVDMTLKLIRTTRPTIMPVVPTLFNAIRNHPKLKADDLKSIRSGVSGGAPLPVELKKNFEKEAGVIIVEGYGLSETSPIATCNPLSGPVKEGSIGLPMPRTVLSLRSLDDPMQEVPKGEKGEICIAGPQVMKGYWNKPDETAAVFAGDFFRTGDVAIMDDDGFFYIVDRIKDLILCSGYNVYPRQIEEAIYQHPAVEEVTVIGIPDEYRGEAPKAFIKLRDGQSATKEEMLKFLEPKLNKIEMPSQIEFRDALPKTMVGKLSKKELREEATGAN